MKLRDGSANIAVAGTWNPAILNPSWLTLNAFDPPGDAAEPVQVEFTVGGIMRYTMRGIKLTPGRDFLILEPASVGDASLDATEGVVRRILENLRHTPISAFGYNFSFVEETPSREQLTLMARDAFDLARLEFDFEIASRSAVTALSVENHFLNLTQSLQNNQLTVDFNFHYPTPNADLAVQQLRAENSNFRQNYAKARDVLRDLYAAELQVEEVH